MVAQVPDIGANRATSDLPRQRDHSFPHPHATGSNKPRAKVACRLGNRLRVQAELPPIKPEWFFLCRINPQRILTSEDAEALTRNKLRLAQGRREPLLHGQPTINP
jgi:hypothetical protein